MLWLYSDFQLSEIWNSQYRIPACLAVTVPPAFWAFFWRNVHIKLDASGFRFYRLFFKYADYPLNTHLTTKTDNLVWGPICKIRRTITVSNASHYKTFICDCFSADTLPAFSNAVNKLRIKSAASSQTMQNLADENSEYSEPLPDNSTPKDFFVTTETVQIPRKELLRKERRYLLQLIGGVALVSAGLAALWYFTLYLDSPRSFADPFGIMLFIFLMFPLGPFLFYVPYYLINRWHSVSEIRFTSNQLIVDKTAFHFREIDMVKMTAISQKSANNLYPDRRKLVIVSHGKRKVYYIGSAPHIKQNYIYEEYSSLIHKIVSWCDTLHIPYKPEA